MAVVRYAQCRIYVVECLGSRVWWESHFLIVQKLNQVCFNKMYERLVVAGTQPGFC